jgi:uncharacterized membrane protein
VATSASAYLLSVHPAKGVTLLLQSTEKIRHFSFPQLSGRHRGLLLFLVKPETISRIISALTQHELSEDSHDLVARALVRLADQVSADSQVFAGVYLLSHGVIKVFLVEALLRGRLWAYPTAIVFFALFIAYQMYRYYLGSTVGMIALSLLDLVVIALTWLEYRRLKGVHRQA